MWGNLFDPTTILLHTLVAIMIVMTASKTHEFIHIYMAKKFGIKINSIDWWKNEIDLEVTRADPRWKAVAYTPYLYLIPAGLLIVMCGVYMQYFGLLVGGAAILLTNIVSIKGEGREECEKNVPVESQQTVTSTETKEL